MDQKHHITNNHFGGLFALYLISGLPPFVSGPEGCQLGCGVKVGVIIGILTGSRSKSLGYRAGSDGVVDEPPLIGQNIGGL